MMNEDEIQMSEKYRELNLYARHYDQRLWMIPSTAYGLSLFFCGTIFKLDIGLTWRAVLATLNAAIFSGFLMQYVKDRSFQLDIQKKLNVFDDFGATVGDKTIDNEDRWFIKFAKKHVLATNYVFYVMLLTLLTYGAVALYYIKAVFYEAGL